MLHGSKIVQKMDLTRSDHEIRVNIFWLKISKNWAYKQWQRLYTDWTGRPCQISKMTFRKSLMQATEKPPVPTPGPVTNDGLFKLFQVIGILLGIGLGGSALYKKNADPIVPEVFVVPKDVKAKKCELNSLTVASAQSVTFFVPPDAPMTYKISGNTIDFVPKSFPVVFYVTAVQNNAMVPPKTVIVVADDSLPPGPGPAPPDPFRPVPPGPTPNPNDPFETALRTAWQAEFSPDKGSTRLKLIQLYQYLLTQVPANGPPMGAGDILNKLNAKANELQVTGKAPTFQSSLNAELGKLLPHSPSVLVDPTVANAAFNKAISVMQMLTP